MTGRQSDDAQPLVSIVIPAYNHAAYLDEAIRSVLEQDYPRIELIALDDGSEDNTMEVLASYAGRLHYETHPNMGQAKTLNKGWTMSRGDILSYLSADDYLLPGAVSKAVKLLREEPELALVYCDYNFVDERGNILQVVHAPDFSLYNAAVRLECAPGPAPFFRRGGYLAAGGWDETLRRIPDYEFWLRLALHGPFKRIPHALAAWRRHSSSQTFSPATKAMADEPVKVLTRYFRTELLPPAVAAARREGVAAAYVYSARLNALSHRPWRALAKMAAAVATYPPILRTSKMRYLLDYFRTRARTTMQDGITRFLRKLIR